jgi:hypothetical protein
MMADLSRRGLLGTGAAVATASVAAAAPAVNPDAELIRLCGVILAGNAELNRYTVLYGGNEPPEVKARARALVDDGHKLSTQIAEIRASTPEGLEAKAKALMGQLLPDADGDPMFDNTAEMLGWSIARDLLGGNDWGE